MGQRKFGHNGPFTVTRTPRRSTMGQLRYQIVDERTGLQARGTCVYRQLSQALQVLPTLDPARMTQITGYPLA